MAKPVTPSHVKIMRSQLGRARGLGAAKSGLDHWWVERITSVALVPLTIWFILSVLHLLGAGQPEVAAWAAHPLNAVLLLALVVMTFHHMQLGLQVVYEDYIHDHRRLLAVTLATKGAALLLGLTAILAVLKLALGNAGH
jgi:succinate dehydrogenase / fumarate reductase membrane anchor subunit